MEKIIKYPEDFVSKVKLTFPTHSQLHWLLDSNSSAAGAILNEMTDDNLDEYEELAITQNNGSYEYLETRCHEIINKRDIYSQWCDIYNKQADKAEKITDNAERV